MNRKQLRRVAEQFCKAADSLTLHYNLVMFTMFLWGVYAVFGDEPATAVSERTSPLTYQLWVMWQVLAPPVIWVGQLIPNQRVQWWLRWAGDSALGVMIATHVYALTRENRDAVSGTYLLFVLSGMGMVCVCLAARDLIRAIYASSDCEQLE